MPSARARARARARKRKRKRPPGEQRIGASVEHDQLADTGTDANTEQRQAERLASAVKSGGRVEALCIVAGATFAGRCQQLASGAAFAVRWVIGGMGRGPMGGKHKARGEMTPAERAAAREADQRRIGATDKRSAQYREHLEKKALQQSDRLHRDPAAREANRRGSHDWRARMTPEQYADYLADQRKRNRAQRQRLKAEGAEREERAAITEQSHYEWLLDLYETGVRNFRAVEASMAPARRASALRNLNTIYAELTELADRIGARRREGED